jgi:hypothetical protein
MPQPCQQGMYVTTMHSTVCHDHNKQSISQPCAARYATIMQSKVYIPQPSKAKYITTMHSKVLVNVPENKKSFKLANSKLAHIPKN